MNTPLPSPTPRAAALRLVPDMRWIPMATVGLLAAIGMMGDVLFRPVARALGSPVSEAPGHLWGLWCTASRLWEYGPLVRVADLSWPEGWSAHLMDPINLVSFLPFYALAGGGASGAMLGWNALHLSAPLIATWGCWRLARRMLPDDAHAPWAAAVLGLAFAASPYLLATPSLGRSELLPAVLWPWHLALLHEWLRLPQGEKRGLAPPPRWRTGLGAGLTLGAMVLGGWYLAVFLAILEVPVALWMARRCGWAEAAWRLALVAGVGALLSAPALWATLTFPPPHGLDLSGMERRGFQSYSRFSLPVALRIRGFGGTPTGTEAPPYTGVVGLALALLGALRAPRRVLPWLLLGLLALTLAFGPLARPTASPDTGPPGQATTLTMPAAWLLRYIPGLPLLQHWSRLTLLASMLMALAAMQAFRALSPARSGPRTALAVVVLAAMFVDQATFPRAWSFQRPSFSAALPAELSQALAALPPGPVVPIPLEGRAGDPHDPFGQGLYQLWQLSHGRPLSAGAIGDEDVTSSTNPLTALVRAIQLSTSRGQSSLSSSVSESELGCARIGALTLARQGFAGVTLHLQRRQAAALQDLLIDVLGEPVFKGDWTLAWNLQNVSATGLPHWSACEAMVRR